MKLDVAMSVVELGAVLVSAALLIYLSSRSRNSPRSRVFAHGGLLVVFGLALAILAHAWETIYRLLHPELIGQAHTLMSNDLAFERVHTVLSTAGFLTIALGLFFALRNRQSAEVEILDTRRELEVSKYFEYQAEERFRYLFDSTSNSVYCYRFDPPMPIDLPIAEQIERSYDALLQDCNVMFARELGADDPTEAIGGRLGGLESAKDKKSHEDYFRAFVESDYRLDEYGLDYVAPDGDRRSLQINVVGIVRGGLLHRMWAVESNLTLLRQTEEALAQRRHFQTLVATVSSQLVTTSDQKADVVVQECCTHELLHDVDFLVRAA